MRLTSTTIARTARRLTARLKRPVAQLVYHPGYAWPYNHLVDRTRAAAILGHLIGEGFTHSRFVSRPARASLLELGRVHTDEYLAKLEDPAQVLRIFGDRLDKPTVAAAIEQQRLMVSGTLLAARQALADNGPQTIVNLGGGLHHAQSDQGAGFCLLNDVAVAIADLRDQGFDGRVLVIDLDLHQGDGTRRIFASDESVYTYSVHAVDWDTDDALADLNIALGAGIGDRAYLQTVQETLPVAFSRARPDLVFYLAGVDVADDDALGNWRVSGDGILRRDQLVRGWIGERPSVWLLAGGYGPDAWRHSARSLSWLMTGRDRPIASEVDVQLDRFRQVAKTFDQWELTGEAKPDIEITEADVFGDLWRRPLVSRLLGFYSAYGVELALARYGVIEHLRGLGYTGVTVSLDLDHPTGQRVQVQSDDSRRDLLIEIVLREAQLDTPYRFLAVEWLLLQNPRAEPTAERPLLPGQTHPGLGCLTQIGMMLIMACERLGFDGLVFTPAHYHLAVQAKGRLRFLDAEREAAFVSLEAALEGADLREATALLAGQGVVDDDTGERVTWSADPMVLPVSERLREHFRSPEYERNVAKAVRRLRVN